MINPNENDLTRDEPLPTQLQPRGEEIGSTGREQFRQVTNKFSTAMSQTWDQTKEKAGRARARKSCASDPECAWDRNREWPCDPLRLSHRAKDRSRGEVAARGPELERSFAAVSLAII